MEADRSSPPRHVKPRTTRHVSGRLDRVDVDDLVLVVNEAVTNGSAMGRGPVYARLWAGPDRIVVTVSDQGKGPTNPFVGLVPTSDTDSAGMGLWVTHQLCNHVTFETGARLHGQARPGRSASDL